MTFAIELTSRGAKVWLIDLAPQHGVDGIDDYVGIHGPEAALKLFDTARAFDPKEQLAKLDNRDYGNGCEPQSLESIVEWHVEHCGVCQRGHQSLFTAVTQAAEQEQSCNQ